MIKIYIIQAFLIIYTCASASHDGRTYRINGKPLKPYVTIKMWLKWWHIDNAIEYLAVLGIAGFFNYWMIAAGLFIRVALFDVCYNKAADLPPKFIGTTAWFDRIFYRLFKNIGGAITKSILFLILLIAVNIFLCAQVKKLA